MGAYGFLDEAVAGLKYGLDSRIEGGWVCKESAGINFGAPVFGYDDDVNGAYNYYNDTAKVVYDADFVTSNSIAFSVNGTSITPVVFATSHAATMTALIAAVEALTGVEAVLDSDDSNGRTLFVRTRGATNTVVTTVTLGGSQATATMTYDSGQVYVGVAMFVQKAPSVSGEAYEQYDAMNVMADGEIWVVPTLAVIAQEFAYIDTTGADVGSFSNAGNLLTSKYRSSGAADALVRLFVHGQTKLTYAGRF